MKKLIVILTILFPVVSFSQDSYGQLPKEEIYEFVDTEPEFPGGEQNMYQYIINNIKYPETAKENNIQGRVYVKFVVTKDGNITDVEIARSVESSIDAEAIRVIKSMPKWKPGTQRGKPVNVRFTLPIKFSLQ